jgi:hypothetical protein
MANYRKKSGAGFIGFEFLGIDALKNAFQGVTVAMRDRILKSAVQAGAKILVSPIRSATPKAAKLFGKQAIKNPPGTLRKATTMVYRKYKGGDLHMELVGFRRPQGSIAPILERGTVERLRTTQSLGFDAAKGYTPYRGVQASTGRVPAMPWVGPVFERLKQSVLQIEREEIIAGLDVEKRKASK